MDKPTVCDVCAGEGQPISGRPCICGGTGLGYDEKIGLRCKVRELELQNSEVKAQLKDLIEVIDRDHHLTRGGERLAQHDICEICAIIERGQPKRHRHLEAPCDCDPDDPPTEVKRKWVGPSDVDPMERTMPVTEAKPLCRCMHPKADHNGSGCKAMLLGGGCPCDRAFGQ